MTYAEWSRGTRVQCVKDFSNKNSFKLLKNNLSAPSKTIQTTFVKHSKEIEPPSFNSRVIQYCVRIMQKNITELQQECYFVHNNGLFTFK